MAANEYVPGVCNIGAAEVGRRRRVGWLMSAVSLGGLAILLLIDVHPLWRLPLFLPATIAASGFLQARFRFCVGFARRGVFNFRSVGEAYTVMDRAARAADRRAANRILAYSVLIGAAFTAAAWFL